MGGDPFGTKYTVDNSNIYISRDTPPATTFAQEYYNIPTYTASWKACDYDCGSTTGGNLWVQDCTSTATSIECKLTKDNLNSLYSCYLKNKLTWKYDYDYDYDYVPPLTPSERMRQILQSRMAPTIICGRRSLALPSDVREERARATLRRIIGEKTFRKFIRDGFITVQAKSGLTYRIHTGHGMTEVYDRGVVVERLCVVLQGDFPPTDSLLMRYLLILNDEGEFSKYAVKHGAWKSEKRLAVPEHRTLPELWAELKVA